MLSGAGWVELTSSYTYATLARISGEVGTTLTVGPEQSIVGRGTIEVAVVNEGTIRAREGELLLAGGVTSTGVLEAVEGGILALRGDIDPSQISQALTATPGGTLRFHFLRVRRGRCERSNHQSPRQGPYPRPWRPPFLLSCPLSTGPDPRF